MGADSLNNALNNNLSTQTDTVGDILNSDIPIDKDTLYWYEEITFMVEDEQSINECLDYINSLSNEQKQEFIDICKVSGLDNLDTFIQEYGLPGNENINEFKILGGLTLDLFEEDTVIVNEQFVEKTDEFVEKTENVDEKTENVDEKTENVDEKIENVDEKTENVDEKLSEQDVKRLEFLSELKGLKGINLNNSDIKELIDEILRNSKGVEDISVEKQQELLLSSRLDELINLLDRKENLEDLLNDIAEQQPDKIKNFTDSLRSIDKYNVLGTKIELYIEKHPSLFGRKSISFPTGNPIDPRGLPDMKREGNVGTIDKDDGVEAIVDFSKNPPKRIITNGKYEFEGKPSLGPLLKPTIEYKLALGKLESQKNKIEKEGATFYLKRSEKLKELEEKTAEIERSRSDGSDSDEVTLSLLKTEKIDLELEIKEIEMTLKQKEEEFHDIESKISELKDDYVARVQSKQAEYTRYMNEKDEKKKEMLLFFSDFGFDLLPQSLSDDLINVVNSGNLLGVNGLSQKIDLQNGILGSGGLENEKVNFIRFFNKMLTGSFEEPITNPQHVLSGNKPEFLSSGGSAFNNFLSTNEIDRGDGKKEKVMENGIINKSVLLKNLQNTSLGGTETKKEQI